ncbi:16S rRNA (adenine(1518)-N(6)/adenine(1519)-N(6))-dimethyltransferase RsmA [Egicoccus halophilus]|uniref:16S rRNA (adenine(1518)-N(6)/adenine(1519)-N(6))- dimethyltransferase RsmA n=1 Tax=Egicoccus halophilus TaxID=1670830 RepID=UPI00351A6CAD
MSEVRGRPIGELLTPREVRRLLAERGLAPRKAAGQNFVVDPNTVRRIVDAAGLRADDVVLEIGPGLGSLTLGLAGAVRRVVAVEIDAGLVGALAEVLDGREDVTVVHADALRVRLGDLVDGGPVRLVANLPYNVATPLVMHALEDPAVHDLFVMVQREVGERWAAAPGDPLYAGVSCKLGTVARAQVALAVPRAVFHPVPNVDSVMVRIVRRDDAPRGPERERRFRLIEAAFRQRRKTLRNNLRALAEVTVLERAAGRADIDLTARAERLSPADVARLDAALADAGVVI